MSAPVEIWKPFPLFDTFEVSSTGRVRNTLTNRVRKLFVSKIGRATILLTRGPRKELWMVHRMVAITFHGPPPSKIHQVAHNNGNPRDNRAENLRWATPKENAADRIAHGRNCHGEGNGNSKFPDEVIPLIKRDRERGLTQYAIADRYGISQPQVWNILHGKQRVRAYGEASGRGASQ